jgi:Ni,Fe-hydrogenase III component G
MSNEEDIQQQLVRQFPVTEGKFRIQRARRIWVEVPVGMLLQFIQYAKDELKFVEFCIITGLDEGENLGVLYHVAQSYTGIMLNIKISVPKTNPVVPTITHLFPAADLPEREIEDLLGAKVDGLAPGRRYPLPDNWPQDEHPLLKDWKPKATAASTEAQNG